MTPEDLTALTAQNHQRAKVLGCTLAMSDARQSQTSEEDISVAIDGLEEEGWDKCVAFLSEQTNGRYPPKGSLLPTMVPKRYVADNKIALRAVWWDCLEFRYSDTVQPMTRLFGNANVGNLNLTNLQVAGCLASDREVFIGGWSVTTNAMGETLALVEDLMTDAVATFIVGDRRWAERHMADLYREARPIEQLIPVRQSMSVELAFFGSKLTPFKEELLRRSSSRTHDSTKIWINLEGWQIREDYTL